MRFSSFSRRLMIILFIGLLFVLFSVVLSVSIHHSSFYDDYSNVFSYQYNKVNPKTDEINRNNLGGFDHLEYDEYDILGDAKGVVNSISHFGTDEYECTGNCFCDIENHSRRTTGTVISRGLTFLVAAASSIAAKNLAKSYFEEECQILKSKEGDCEPGSISSEVEDCFVLASDISANKDEKATSKTSKRDTTRKKFVRRKRFHCKGACVYNLGQNTENYYKELNLWNGRVKRWEGFLFGIRLGKFKKYKCYNWKLEKGIKAESLIDAYSRFVSEELHPYCFHNSEVELKRKDGSIFTFNACVGYIGGDDVDSWSKMLQQKSVFCEASYQD